MDDIIELLDDAVDRLRSLLERSREYVKACADNNANGYHEYDPDLLDKIDAALEEITSTDPAREDQ